MADADLVAGLDRDRLLELATWCDKESHRLRREIIEMETGSRVAPGIWRMERAARYDQVAALCRAVAGVQDALRAHIVDGKALALAGIGDRGISVEWFSDVLHWRKSYETVASALGAVAMNQEESNAID